jgi:hypothetical protein
MVSTKVLVALSAALALGVPAVASGAPAHKAASKHPVRHQQERVLVPGYYSYGYHQPPGEETYIKIQDQFFRESN